MEGTPHHERLSWLQCAILVLSVYVLVVVFLETIVAFSPATVLLLGYIDSIICLVFLYDFFLHLYKAPSKRAFLKWGWLDFISSIPMFGIFRWARIARVVRILRLIRAFRSSKILIAFLFEHRARSTLATVGLMSAILVIFSSVAILHVETGPESNIKTPADALWWALTTITTVGYGDKYPVTTEGRVIAVFLMVAGVGLFATFTGFISTFFLESTHKKSDEDMKELVGEIRALRRQVESLRDSNLSTGVGAENPIRVDADVLARSGKP